MMFGVIAVIEKEPVINFPVTAHTPGNRFIRVGAVMTEVTIQVAEAMAEIEERQEKQHESPVDEMDRFSRDDDCHRDQNRNEHGQFDVAPTEFDFTALGQLALDRAGIVAKEAEKNVAPRILGPAIVSMFVNRDPINRLTIFIRAIGVALVMLHVNHVVVGLRKAAGRRFDDAENSVEQLRTEKGVVDEVM